MLPQIYSGVSVFLSSLLPLVFGEAFVFTWWGVLAAYIYVPVCVGLFAIIQV